MLNGQPAASDNRLTAEGQQFGEIKILSDNDSIFPAGYSRIIESLVLGSIMSETRKISHP
jgi:hypothetical protein